MSGILRLESLTKGNTLKQGDKTPLKYRLFDADGEKLNIAGKSAKVRLVYPDFLTIGYEKDGLTVAQDDTVTFTIDNVIPSRVFHVEIIVDDKFIFPSRADESKFTVDKSSLGTESNIVEIVGVDAVVRKAVDLINDDPSLIIDEDKLVGDIISNTGIGSINEYYKAFNELKPKAELSISQSAEALTKSQNALNVANGIDSKATNALSLSKSADTLSKSVQEQFNQVVIDGDSSVEAAQARVDASGQTNPTLKARLDKEHNEVTAKLAQTINKEASQIVNKLSSKQVSTIRERQPLVLFTDDDGNKAIMTKLKPISEETGVPFTIALLVDRTERNTGISVEQAKQLQDELGWEVASHGLADVALGNPLLTDEEIEEQVRDSMIWFREHGLDVKNYVYPGGQATKKAQRIVSKYANGVLGTGVSPNVYPLQQYNINRLAFPASAPNNNLDYYKSKVDEAVANNQILVWMLHCGMVEFDATQQQHLRDLIAYIKSLGVKMPTLQGALDLVGNVIDINDRQYFMSADGQNNIINTIIKTGNLDGSDAVKITDNPDTFERNKTIVSLVNNNRNLSPSTRGGVLITTSLSNSTFVSQTFIDQGGRQFTRHAINSTTWSNWNAITISKSRISTTIPSRNVPAGTAFWVVINDATILPTDAHVAQPQGTLELGLTWSCWSHGNTALVLEIYNPTKADISMAERVFNIHRFN